MGVTELKNLQNSTRPNEYGSNPQGSNDFNQRDIKNGLFKVNGFASGDNLGNLTKIKGN